MWFVVTVKLTKWKLKSCNTWRISKEDTVSKKSDVLQQIQNYFMFLNYEEKFITVVVTDYLTHKKDSLKVGHIWFEELSSRQRIEVIIEFME